METDLKLIFLEICKDYNQPESIITEPLNILQRNFFFKLKDVKRLKADDWEKLNLPSNLFNVLQDKISYYESNSFNPFSSKITSNTDNIVKAEDTTDNKLKLKVKVEVEEDKFKHQKVQNTNEIKEVLPKLIEGIQYEAKVSTEIISTLKTLYGIIERIVQSPLDQAVQKINTTSKVYLSKIAPYKSAEQMLIFVGFEKMKTDQGLYYCFEGKLDLLKVIFSDFESILKEKKIVKSDFDPYACYVSSNNENKVKDITKGIPEWDKLLRQLKEARLKIMLNSKSCKRDTIIYDARKTLIKEEDNTNELTSYKDIEEYDFLLYAKNILKESRDDKFKIRSRIEFEKLSEEKVCDKSTIRLKFKNEFILQGNFALQETVESIYNFLIEHLNSDIIKDTKTIMIQSGIPSKKLNRKKTIHEESLFPNCLLYVDFDYHCNDLLFLKEDSLKNHLKN